ncbi:secretin N-terminal domain-containing protein [Candidatus Accumulibacter vicinus]|uniref:General secretion pathway protein D n=1 Tax=Candidatus Accumulibacter vicinus TaxID=2954382 RepID=A0A084Y5T4_9PROT|nr:secretin N-terminal domain-containing protein [Candidatus Accumulibacter vicinus]KFB70078.1 MAG: General secretion pathway protein D [Candidatus Accumulibacter vicinus]
MSKANSGRSGPAGWRRGCLSMTVALLLAGCAAQNAYREGQTLLAEDKVDAGLAKIQEAMTLDPSSAEYRIAYIRAQDRYLNASLAKAERALAEARYDEAEGAFRRALMLQHGNDRALAGLRQIESARRHDILFQEAELAWAKKDPDLALARLRAVLAAYPKHERALALQRLIEEKTAKAAKESVLTAAFRKPITIEFRDTPLKTVFEVISRTSGLNFVFDKDLRADQKTTIFLRNSTIEAAINILLLTNQLEQRVLDGNSILIYPSTPAKQKEYQALVVKTYYLANSDAKTVGTTLKTILKTRDIVVDDKLNLLMIRDSPEAIRLADKLVALQDVPEPEVMLEVEILEVKRSRLQALGINWPDNIALRALPVDKLTLKDLGNITSATTGVTVGPAVIRANQLDTDVNLLANPRIRARNREKAKILIGDRVPNITSTITATGFSSESITYIDVGLKLDIEPTIYLDNEVAMKVTLEVSNIVNRIETKSGTVAYQIGTRTATSVLRLKDGENQLLAGLISDEDRRTANKVPFIGEIPILGRLFGSHSDEGIKTEIVLSITPRILRNIQRAEAYLAEFDGGTETSFRGRFDGGGGGATPVFGALAPSLAASAPPAAGTAKPGGSATPGGQVNPFAPQAQSGSGLNAQAATAQTSAASSPVNPFAPAVEGSTLTPESLSPSAVQPALQAAGSALLLWQGPTQIRVGDTFALQLVMQTDRPVVSVPLAIGFDPRLLQVANVSEGGFLKQGGAQTSFTYRIDPGGQVLMTATRSGDGGATAPDSLATINFRALAAGAARVELITIAPVASGGLTINATLPGAHAVTITP